MQGVPTPEEQIAEFRAEYIYSRNASATGRKLGIEERTVRRLAEEYEAEPAFAEAVRVLRARYLERLTTMRMSVAETAHARFLDDNGGIDVREFGDEEKSTVVITDKRHEYGKLVLDAEKNAHNLARFEAETSGAIQPDREVTIRVIAAEPPKDDDGGEKA